MSKLPNKYSYLLAADMPLTIRKAMELYGTLETAGTANNPVIIAWAKEVGQDVANVYKADSIPWCGLFAAVVAKRAGKAVVKSPLWALSWSNFGQEVLNPGLGDVLVFTRNGGGHVGFYVGEDATCYHVLGGNQSDSVNIARINKARLYTARRPSYKLAPSTVKAVALHASGAVSTNEA